MAGDGKASEHEETAGQRADPVAAKNDDLAQAGGPAAGEPGAGGTDFASGGQHGRGASQPSGDRADPDGPPPSNAAAPLVHTAMDEEVRDAEEKAHRMSPP